MKILVIIGLLIFVSSLGSAQSFDPDCYYPRIGIEIDTVLRKPTGGYFFADNIIKHPNATGEEQICITGHPSNPPFLTVLGSGSVVDIHALQVRKKWTVDLSEAVFANFRSTKYKDAFLPYRIYWADDNGDFDSSRYTDLWSSFSGDLSIGFSFQRMNPYVANVTDDSLDDIILMGYSRWIDESKNRTYLYFFNGANLYHPDTHIVYSDSAYDCGPMYEDTVTRLRTDRIGVAGDFRGAGREDWIATGPNYNMFYYQNDPPFTMSNFYRSMKYDTFLVAWENSTLRVTSDIQYYLRTQRPLRAFSKPSWDKSYDFVGRFNTNDERKDAWFFFRGGPEFGSKRLYLDSVDELIRKPAEFGDGFSLGYGMSVCGDMSGSGNIIAKIGGSYGHDAGESLFYMLEKAFDDDIDINISYAVVDGTGGGTSPVVCRSDNDSFGDIIFGITNYQNSSLDPVSSSLAILHGSTKIPVRLNPKYAVEEIKQLEKTQMYAYPNPCGQKTVLTFENCSAGALELQVFNNLGRVMLREEIVDVDGLQQYAVDMSALPAGVYHLRLTCPSDGWSATTNIIKQGTAQTPWSLDLKKMVRGDGFK